MAQEAEPFDRWDLIRRLYEGEVLTLPEIGALAGLKARSITGAAARERWNRRQPGGRLGPDPHMQALSRVAGAGGAGGCDAEPALDRAALVRRLWAAIERHMEDEEAGLHGSDPRWPQTLDTLVRTVERLSAMAPAGGEGSQVSAPDAEALRAELLRRIEGLARG
ncbi:hypothetical protein [Lutibaculum baratangense]|uniref:Uncharacterized protein n=1 Tax=Lutibaculum baratangense AMV1 TaxID=631454 RepID=V4QSN3_9HYPH|nr:hypothetical protein [Lutibaculum baratangense]ESR22787.1 hypothetical protein N177_3924 [Lutibaculum baratangense AMV1]